VIDVSIVNNELSGSSDLFLRGVDISNDSDEQEAATSIDAIPLGTAFNMLKDENDNVELDIPLSGNVADPKFGWSSFINIVTKKAVMAATETYLMQTFVPYANIISIAKFAGKEMLKVNVEDLMYQQAQIKLQPEQLIFVNELATLLKDQKDLQLKVCPIAVTAEPLPGDISNLKQLAQRRGEALKVYLVSDKGIESKRILLCTPKIDETANAKPRVEFTL